MALLAVRQGPHHVAQKSTNSVCPRNLEIMDGNKSSLETCPVSLTVKPVFLLFNSIFFIISLLTAEQNVELKTFSSPVYAEMLTQVNKEIIKKIELNILFCC